MTIQISDRYILTTEHAASSYGQPVLVRTTDQTAYGAKDLIDDGLFGILPAVDVVREFAQSDILTAHFTHGAISPKPEAIELVNRFMALAGR